MGERHVHHLRCGGVSSTLSRYYYGAKPARHLNTGPSRSLADEGTAKAPHPQRPISGEAGLICDDWTGSVVLLTGSPAS